MCLKRGEILNEISDRNQQGSDEYYCTRTHIIHSFYFVRY